MTSSVKTRKNRQGYLYTFISNLFSDMLCYYRMVLKIENKTKFKLNFEAIDHTTTLSPSLRVVLF